MTRSPNSRRRLTIAMMLESDGPGGAEILTLRLSEELSARGHQIVPVTALPGTGWLAEQYSRRGFAPESVPLRGKIAWAGTRALIRIIKHNKVDVIHSHEFEMAVRGALIARLCGSRHVITIHGAHRVTESAKRRVALRAAFAISDFAVMVSNDTLLYMSRQLGIAASKMLVVHNGVPVVQGDPLPPQLELGLSSDEIVLLAVGNLEVHKGHMDLLEAMRRLRDEDPALAWRLIIAGGRGGPEHDRLLAFVQEHSMQGHVSILLFRQDVPALLAASHIFVMPSLWEGLPLSILEAMLAGLPVVASAVAGIPEAVGDGETGFLCPPASPSELADKLRLLLRDEALRTRLGNAGRTMALSRFTVGAMADAYEDLYYAALGPTGKNGTDS